jgi:hypothetical protein
VAPRTGLDPPRAASGLHCPSGLPVRQEYRTGTDEMEEGGTSRGEMIDLFLRAVNRPPGEPWSAAFVHHVGYWSHYVSAAERSSWPLPSTASCYMLGAYAKKRGVPREERADGDVCTSRFTAPATVTRRSTS